MWENLCKSSEMYEKPFVKSFRGIVSANKAWNNLRILNWGGVKTAFIEIGNTMRSFLPKVIWQVETN